MDSKCGPRTLIYNMQYLPFKSNASDNSDINLFLTESTNRRNEEGAESIAVENRFRYSNVRDITGLDFYIRGVSPITNEAFRQCTSNPLFNCSVNNDFE